MNKEKRSVWGGGTTSREIQSMFLSKKRVVKSLIGLIISVYCIYLLQSQIVALRDEFSYNMFKIDFLILSILTATLSQFGRAIRWMKFIEISGSRADRARICDAYFKSVLANNLLPFRVGDVLRAIYYGRKFTGSPIRGTVLIVFEKVLDIAVLLSVVAVVFYNEALDYITYKLLTFSFVGLTLLAIGIIALLLLFWFRKKTKKAIEGIQKIFEKLKVNKSKGMNLGICTLTIWILEALSFYFAIQSLGIDFTYLESLILMSIVTLSTAIPSTPGYFGTFHLVFVEVLRVLGTSTSNSLIAAISVHLILWTSSNLIGIWYVLSDAWLQRSGKVKT